MTDLSFDVDALFEHMLNNLEHRLEDEKEWQFSLRSSNLSDLEQVAHELDGEFEVHIQEVVECIHEDGHTSIGDPLLVVRKIAALLPEDVKAISKRIQTIAEERELVYDGVTCLDPIFEDEIFGWLSPDDAVWRLRHMSDIGIEDNADLPWTFLVITPDLASTNKASSELSAIGFDDFDKYDEPDEAGEFGLCLFIAGRNNEAELMDACTKITQIAERNHARVEGIQFYTREEAYEVFAESNNEDDEQDFG